MTVFGANGAVQSRGCSDVVEKTHLEYCDENPEKCLACKSTGCNNAYSMDNYVDCFFCDSDVNADCAINFVAGSTRTRKCQKSCMTAMYKRSSSVDSPYELSRSCLDDLELDDQELCQLGQMEFCKACEGDRCNVDNLPEAPLERHECFKCLGDECEMGGKIEQCSAYTANDQCYYLFDNSSSLISMGCRSEFESEVVIELIKQKQMLLCEGKNCNDMTKIPDPKICSICNSETNPWCATNPNLVADTQRCSLAPYTECYTRVNERGHTERGCLTNLDSDQFYACLTNADGLCEICTGDNCNELDVYPADRLRCHQCSSQNEANCTSFPNHIAVCPLYVENDACITNLRNDVLTRGCASTMKCDDPSDIRTCRTCNTAGCNTVDLTKVSNDGQPGKWQDVPITCLTCSSEQDCEDGAAYRPCTTNPYDNCVTAFNANGKVEQRGCYSNVETYCAANDGKCYGCNSNGCNTALSEDEFVQCLVCDSDNNADCVQNVTAISKTRMCHKSCMTAMYPRENEQNAAYELVRSCLDDMDLDDRELCAAGQKEYCQTCSTANCNTAEVPAQRLSCNFCDSDDCQVLESKSCSAYRDKDQCYIMYDENQRLVNMGCRSEFSNSYADFLLAQKRMYLCEGDNCNTFENQPESQTCTLCSSRTDVNCATNPGSVLSTTTCSKLPYTNCYARVLSDGSTERGCLNNLYDEEFVSCLNGSSDSCTACTGANCNNKIFPSDRATCHICDSASNSDCTSNPNSLSVCPRYEENDICVTSYRNGITTRGCGSSLVCDATNPRVCSKCQGAGCNTIDLAANIDNNFGKWQDLPLTCLKCEGDSCNSETLEEETCSNNYEQDCVTVFDATGKVVRRGCEFTVSESCAVSGNDCFNCKSNKCNTASAKTDFNECIYCNSNDDLNCVWNPLSSAHRKRQCQGGCMTALYASTSGDNPSYDLIRTCLNDKEAADQTKCSDEYCSACTGANCNSDNLPTERHSCYFCENGDCQEPVSKMCPLYKADDQCFIWFDEFNSVEEMGCISSFRNQQIENILATKRALLCKGDNCNDFSILPQAQECAVCDSNENPLCATNAFEIGSINSCSMMPYTDCYSKLKEDGSTVRGCLSDLSGSEFAACVLGTDANCGKCTGNGCNRDVFPADRLQCYTCTSLDDPNCESFPAKKQPCAVVSESEGCRTALSGNTTLRGCRSEIFCDASDIKTCRSCSSSECNAIDLANRIDDNYHGVWQDLPLKCHSCEGEHCEYSLGPAYSCGGPSIEQDCVTVFEANGNVKRRGCSHEVENYEDRYCRENPQLCKHCKSNECNSAWSTADYVDCIFCSSADNANCASNPSAISTTRSCNKECMVAALNGTVIRSCLDDKELFVQHDCRTDPNSSECISCTGNKCNDMQFSADRLSCHVCADIYCMSSKVEMCANYDENDYCYAKYNGLNVEKLGCASSESASDLSKWQEAGDLYRCEDSACNDLVALPTPSTCVHCDSSTNVACAQSPANIDTSKLCHPLKRECITYLDAANNTLRGCIEDISQVQQNSCLASKTCTTCNGNTCNAEVIN